MSSFTLLIIFIFSAPNGTVSDLRVTTNFTSITVRWQPVMCFEQNGIILQYTVNYTESSINKGPFNITMMSFIASSLYPGTSYTVKIAAVNSIGLGPYIQHRVSTMLPPGRSLCCISYILFVDILFYFA